MGMVTIEESADERSIVTPDCRLAFRFETTRWSHRLQIGNDTFARSVEPDPDRDDYRLVASPTYQDLHFQVETERVYALLVGQYGPRHFSASFAVSFIRGDSCEGRGATRIEVDVAERCRERIDALASTYLVPSAGFSDRHGGSWLLPEGQGSKVVSLGLFGTQEPPGQIVYNEFSARTLRAQVLRLHPGTPTNNRLIYCWQVADPNPF